MLDAFCEYRRRRVEDDCDECVRQAFIVLLADDDWQGLSSSVPLDQHGPYGLCHLAVRDRHRVALSGQSVPPIDGPSSPKAGAIGHRRQGESMATLFKTQPPFSIDDFHFQVRCLYASRLLLIREEF